MALRNKLKWVLLLGLLITNVICGRSQEIGSHKTNGIYPIEVQSLFEDDQVFDLSFIDQYIEGISVVSLGESTHGSSEVFTVKNQLARYLIENKGFSVFAIEANMVEAESVNKYILSGNGDPKLLVYNLGYWVWDTVEFLELIEWMKDYNEKNVSKLSFVGFDMQSYEYALNRILEFNRENNVVDSIDINSVDSISALMKMNIKDGKYAMNKALINSAYPLVMRFNNTVEKAYQDNCDSFNGSEYKLFKQYCNILKEYFTRYSDEKPEKGYRDYCMAKNIEWIADYYQDQKVIVWAHNGHVKRAEHTMGYFLNLMGIKSYVIGFSLYSGGYTAIDSGEIKSNPLIIPDSSCYEYFFNQVPQPNYFVDVGVLEEGNVIPVFGKKFREIGSLKRDQQYYPSELGKEYDAIIHLKATKSSKIFFK